jgi:hypothetical protein
MKRQHLAPFIKNRNELYTDYNELYSDYIDYKSLHYAQIAFKQGEYEISKALFEKASDRLMEYDGDRWYYLTYSGYVSDWLEKIDEKLQNGEPYGISNLIRNWLFKRLALLKPEWVITNRLKNQSLVQ